MRTDAWGTKIWELHGQLHRKDGPAVEYAIGTKVWWVHNKLHRTDGAAIENTVDGSKEWYVDDCFCCSVDAWARAALMYENMDVNEEAVQQKIQQVMQQDLFN